MKKLILWLLVGILGIYFVSAETAPKVEWNRTYGGSNNETAYSVRQTSDNGYIVAGSTESFGAGGEDFWLVKTDSNGNAEWNKTFGGSANEVARSVQQTFDNGYILTGITFSFGAGGEDFWLVKTDSNGNEEWSKTFGNSDSDESRLVQQTSDNGYIVVGATKSFGAGGYDFWLIKTDSNGNEEWNKTFGGSGNDYAESVQQTFDGGYIIAGLTNSFGAGGYDFWLIKTDSNGNEEWNKTFGGFGEDDARSVQQTSDGGYIIDGLTNSFGAGSDDMWVIKTDSNGNQEWNKTFGGSNQDSAWSVQQTSDNGYIIAGYTRSFGAGSQDFWVIRLEGSCQDNDGDGFNQSSEGCGVPDCNDNDNTVYPNAPELCDGKDNDCNGYFDENIICTEINCSNGVDDDNDNYIDAEDQDCVPYGNIQLKRSWNLFGYSMGQPFNWSKAKINNGTDTKNITEAAQAGWLQGTIYYFDPISQYYKFIPGDDNYLRKWNGYWLYSNYDDLTLMIE